MRTVTMPKFIRPFNKSWTGQAAGGVIEIVAHPSFVLWNTSTKKKDCGAENVTMAAMQCYFRGNANDGQAGLNAHRDILQADLDHVRDHWNTHYIRKSRHNTVPGRPDELLYIPENSGFKDFRCPITKQQLDDMAVCCTTDEEENIFLEYSNYGLESLNFAPSDKLERGINTFPTFNASITIDALLFYRCNMVK
ncbi:hypothetical protein AWC38_SpisGene12690 [Stylophora pistillata]|uniref:Uncharacterized protein n=1 Tax=Stylophora pistillata TaxID=50429 RepID=A0A2B4RYS2_STYPI|nr:hypothetical protein AWC38_SpisGene12690 [Stylophora pistillata]